MSNSNSFFSKKLISWYLTHKRDLPWRRTQLPYHVWLSEIILQQTRVDQGLPYYKAFVSKYPQIKDLANATEEEVLKLWQGLGYYSRARNLYSTAKFITNDLNGEFPSSYQGLVKLKGVGDYTASAIASICFNEASAVVDGNVYRVLSRYYGIETPINSSQGIKEFKKMAQTLINKNNPGDHNQAIMEFGARQCKPQNPKCNTCIFNNSCVSLQKGMIARLPVKLKKTKIKKVYFNYIVILTEDGKTIFQKRTGKGIWENLYQFPLIESAQNINKDELLKLDEFNELSTKYGISSLVLYNEKIKIHKLSHRHIYATFWIAESAIISDTAVVVPQIFNYPVPNLIDTFINAFFKKRKQH
jgi:A/G-specific adenine glycosylase